MEKKTNTPVYYAHFVFNASMPRSIRSKARTFTLRHDTDNHKKGDKITIEARQPKDVPFSIPGVKYILEANKIEVKNLDSRHFMLTGASKEALNEMVDKVKALFKDGQISCVVIHPITEEKKAKKKKPSNNKQSHSIETSSSKRKHSGKFGPKDKQRVPRKTKKVLQKQTVKAVITQVGEFEGLSMSQLKRKKHHDTIVEFVNAWCDKDFKSYAEAMRFVRDNRNKAEIESKLAA